MHKSQILYGTQTGNSQEVAEKLKDDIENIGYEASCADMFDSDPDDIGQYENIYLIVSTWGEGEPPDDSLDYFTKLKEMPDNKLEGKNFAVCGLGDSAYDIFNGFAKDVETEMVRLGCKAITERVDCDIDFEELSDPWIEKLLEHEKKVKGS